MPSDVRRFVGSIRLLLVALLVAAATPSAAEEPPATPASSQGRKSPAKSGVRRAERELPTDVILCRGPRGAVYARDVTEGCRYSRLTPENLVDFGAGADCLLRQAKSPHDAKKKKPELRDCGDVCATLEDGRSCVVGLQRGAAGAWETFSPEKQFPLGDEALRDAVVVCCR